MSQYLLILRASFQCGIHTGEKTKEIQIECNPNELAETIETEKRLYTASMQQLVAETNAESDDDTSDAIVSIGVVQVLPL